MNGMTESADKLSHHVPLCVYNVTNELSVETVRPDFQDERPCDERATRLLQSLSKIRFDISLNQVLEYQVLDFCIVKHCPGSWF